MSINTGNSNRNTGSSAKMEPKRLLTQVWTRWEHGSKPVRRRLSSGFGVDGGLMTDLVQLAYAGYEIRLVEDRSVLGCGDGEGCGYGYGGGEGYGYGSGRGTGDGCGSGYGYGYAYGSGCGEGWGSGPGSGWGNGTGRGDLSKRPFYKYEILG